MKNAMTTKVLRGRTYRTYQIAAMDTQTPRLAAHLISRGFDGVVYMGTSKATGRQRDDLTALFYRQTDGQFVLAL